MEQPSLKDIQIFAAGALALMGLYGVIHVPYDLKAGAEIAAPIASGIEAMALPLAIGILARSRLALSLTLLYLGLVLFGGLLAVGVFASILPWPQLYDVFVKRHIISMVMLTVMFCVFWRTKSDKR
jgi:hypothetical protein